MKNEVLKQDILNISPNLLHSADIKLLCKMAIKVYKHFSFSAYLVPDQHWSWGHPSEQRRLCLNQHSWRGTP